MNNKIEQLLIEQLINRHVFKVDGKELYECTIDELKYELAKQQVDEM